MYDQPGYLLPCTQDVSDVVLGGTLVSGGVYYRPVAPAPHTRSCAYCGRVGHSTVGVCEGCGAPVSRRSVVD